MKSLPTTLVEKYATEKATVKEYEATGKISFLGCVWDGEEAEKMYEDAKATLINHSV